MRCPGCLEECSPGSAFCARCGQRLDAGPADDAPTLAKPPSGPRDLSREGFVPGVVIAGRYRVAHPNVCRVYDVGEAKGRHFICMEYVDGEDLASLLTWHRSSWRAARPPRGATSTRRPCFVALLFLLRLGLLAAVTMLSLGHLGLLYPVTQFSGAW